MNWEYWNTMTEAQQTAFLANWTGAIQSNFQWTSTTITYSFANAPTGLEYMPYVPPGEALGFRPLDPEERAFVGFFFSYLESFLNLDFQEVAGALGDIVFGQHNMTPAGYADLPNNVDRSGVFIDTEMSSAEFGDFAYTTLVHEIGHALGLSHTRGYDGESHSGPDLPVQYDSSLMSIMSYSDMAMQGSFKVVGSLMPLDIAALMEMYGARASAQSNIFRVVDGYAIPGQSGATWTVSGNIPFTVVDTGGSDVLDASAYTNTAGATFIFDEGLWLSPTNPFNQLSQYISASNRPLLDLTGQTDNVPMIGIFQGTVIEKFVGTAGNDQVYGNAQGQAADGGAGTDTFHFSGAAGGYTFTAEAGVVVVVDINAADGNDGTDHLAGFELVSFAGQAPVSIQNLLDPVIWYESRDDVTTVAATWQLMMGIVPLQQGFEYLISSPANPTDLNDPYFAAFNVENTYLNFACNLAFEIPQSLAWYEAEYGNLTFAQAVDKAVDTIIASGASDPAGAKAFFLGAQAYYAQVALDRIVRPGVELDDATKVAMLSSVLYESVRADAGPYGEAVNDFATEVSAAGVSASFGESLFA
jgi:hypothetical protein